MKTKTIFICDDQQDILEIMGLMLESFGYTVLLESNSLKVINRLHDERPDLLILDLWMPVLSGDQILITLRANPALKNLPVLVASASQDGEKIAIAAGANGFIQKPFDMAFLAQTIIKLIGT